MCYGFVLSNPIRCICVYTLVLNTKFIFPLQLGLQPFLEFKRWSTSSLKTVPFILGQMVAEAKSWKTTVTPLLLLSFHPACCPLIPKTNPHKQTSPLKRGYRWGETSSSLAQHFKHWEESSYFSLQRWACVSPLLRQILTGPPSSPFAPSMRWGPNLVTIPRRNSH